MLHENSLPQGAAAKLSGRLMFATLWACGHIGRAVLRPVYDQASQTRDKRLLPSVRGALAFLSELLRRPGGLPPRTILFGAESRPTVKIWTDAMYEEGELSGVAWVAEFPAEPARGQAEVRRCYRYYMLGDDIIEKFAPGKRRYIGQLELLAAITPYTSIRDELKG